MQSSVGWMELFKNIKRINIQLIVYDIISSVIISKIDDKNFKNYDDNNNTNYTVFIEFGHYYSL